MSNHHYRTRSSWTGSTGAGLRGYSREHRVVAEPAGVSLRLTADPSFGGDPTSLNPEQLVVLAASSCQLLSFLGAAARAGVDVWEYHDEASSRLDLAAEPARLTAIGLDVRITVAPGVAEATVRELVEQAHQQCYVANSLAVPVEITTTVLTPGAGAEPGRDTW